MRKFIFSTIFALSTSLSLAEPLSIVSSDLLESYIEESIQNYATQENLELKLKFEGSTKAIDAVKNGDFDIGVVVVPKSLEHKLEGLEKYQIAYQTVVFCVNKGNSINELSLKDLKDIYFKTDSNYAKTWAVFGTDNMSAVQAVSTSTTDNSAVNLFKYTINPRGNFADWVSIIPEKSNLASFVRGTNASISISGMPLAGTKVVPVISPVTTFPVLPSSESLYSGEYPFNLTFYLIFDAKNISKIKESTKFLLGQRLSKAFENAGFYAAPEIFRKKFILELDILR